MQGPLETRGGREDAVLASGPGPKETLTVETGSEGRPAAFQPSVA